MNKFRKVPQLIDLKTFAYDNNIQKGVEVTETFEKRCILTGEISDEEMSPKKAIITGNKAKSKGILDLEAKKFLDKENIMIENICAANTRLLTKHDSQPGQEPVEEEIIVPTRVAYHEKSSSPAVDIESLVDRSIR